MGKKKTPAEKEYTKQLRRIRNFIDAASNRGYSFSPSAYRILYNTPAKITTASVNRLKKVTPEYLYKKAKFTAPTGETMSGVRGRKYEQKRAGEKAGEKRRGTHRKVLPKNDLLSKPGEPPHIADNIVEAVESILTKTDMGLVNELSALIDSESGTNPDIPTWLNDIKQDHIRILRNVFNGQKLMQGKERFAAVVNQNADRIHDLVFSLIYGNSKEGAFQADIQELASILKGNALTIYESMVLDEFGRDFDFIA